VSNPHKSKYDEHPFDPNSSHDDKTEPPDPGNTQVPELKVVWDRRPSFNLDPPKVGDGGGGGGGGGEQWRDASPFRIDLRDVSAQVDSMLATSRVLVAEYTALKARVMSGKDTVFGQKATITHIVGGASGRDGNTYNGVGAGVREERTDPSPVQDMAKQFAKGINPAQEKVLQNIGATLELVGEYIAAVNRSGQVYAYSDRHSRFPAPPNASA